MEPAPAKKLDTEDLETRIKKMYREVAVNPAGRYHFEMGRPLAEKLGYRPAELDAVPSQAIASFAGVGYFMDMVSFKEGDAILDLGSGSGMDSFIAAGKASGAVSVTGIDMTDEQLAKATKLAAGASFHNLTFVKGYLENLPFADSSFDLVISNGVINLCPDKEKVFAQISRVLKPGGKMALADIVTEHQLPETITCDATLWASCIGGAGQQDAYKAAIENAGLQVLYVRNNEAYGFISPSAQSATKRYGVKSVSVLAEKK